MDGPIEGLHPESITHKESAAVAFVDDCEGEDPLDTVESGIAPFDVCPEQDFGVGRGSKLVALRHEFVAEQRRVVQLSVVHERDAAIGIVHRLCSRG